MKFVNLHCHTNASMGDAIGTPQEYIDYVRECGGNTWSMTDHGNMNMLPQAYLYQKELEEAGENFKVIYGMEAYYIDSLDTWNDLREAKKKEKKATKKEEKDDSITKSFSDGGRKAQKDPLNRRYHLVLLAMNDIGLKNLFKLVSKSNTDEYFYRYSRIDAKLLERHSEGLLCSSACLGGVLSQCYFENSDKTDEAIYECIRDEAQVFIDIFGKDRYFLELQWNAIPEQHIINKHLIRLAKETGLTLISTCDGHYPRPELWESRELYKRLAWMKTGNAIDPLPESVDDLEYELYPKSGTQIWESYKKYGEGQDYDDSTIRKSIEITAEIAEKCEKITIDTTIRLPSLPDEKKTLGDFCRIGMDRRNFTGNKEYEDRLAYELDIIEKRGFDKYFLLMRRVAEEAKRLGPYGTGRGSAAGCLISYLIEITQIDPIEHGLQFERFLDVDGNALPDIDFDNHDPLALKEMLGKEWKKKYGIDVVLISNFNTMQLRSLIKDISKFYDVPFQEVNDVTGAMLNEAIPLTKKKHGVKAGVVVPTFEEVMEFSTTLQKFLRKYPQIAKHVNILNGQGRSKSRHAGGCLIERDLGERLPLIRSGGVSQTPWPEGQNTGTRFLEPMGFLKFDLLGLATLRMIQDAVHNVLRRKEGIKNPHIEDFWDYYDQNLHPDVINFDDQEVYEDVFHRGKKWAGIFQFSQNPVQSFCKSAKPTSLNDLSTITAIYRPGPLIADVDKKYIAVRRNELHIEHPHAIVDDVLADASGLLVYQEHIASIVHRLGKNVSLAEGNKLRKVIVKKGFKEAEEQKEKIFEKFAAGCKEKGIGLVHVKKMWKDFEAFSKYAFNKSHSVSYAAISFQCAWLAHYHPAEWAAAFLERESEAKKEEAINIVQGMGYKIVRPNINLSERTWTVSPDGKSLIQPLTSIKGLGLTALEQIMEHRPFNTIEELLFNEEIKYNKLTKKALDVLTRAQALSMLVDKRFTGLKHFWSATAVDRPKDEASFTENIERYAPEGDFTDEEKVSYLVELTGVFPFELALPPSLLADLEQHMVPTLGEYDKELGTSWFIPRDVELRKTKNGKPFLIIHTIDTSGYYGRVRCWGFYPEKDKIYLNKPYMAKLDYDEKWGFSIRSFSKKMKLLA